MTALLKIGLAILATTAAAPGGAEELGRLFFTPQQRLLLDQGRQPGKSQPGRTDSVTVNGIVQRHGGKRTVWINGIPRLAGESDERSPETASISVPGRQNKIKAKVGQKISVNPDAPK